MMESTAEKAIAALLTKTETAHGVYEMNVLGGVFDEAWSTWYAAYLLDHGLGDRLPGAKSLELLTWLPCWRGSPRTTSKGTRPALAGCLRAAESSRDSAVLLAKNLLLLRGLSRFNL